MRLKFEKGTWVIEKKSKFVIRAYDDMIEKNFDKWTPSKGELCVFWNYPDTEDKPVRYVISCFNKTAGIFYKDLFGDRYVYCAPIEFAREFTR